MAVDFRENVSDPYAVDLGNKTIQEMTASKTVQFAMFTTNDNAVWGSVQQLRKESYPFALMSFPVNRNAFRYQVGDCFKWSYTRYGITDMVCRVLQIEEESLESENIIIHAMQDIYSVTNGITVFTDPVDNATPPTDYSISPFVNQVILEAPYSLTGGTTKIIPLASRESPLDAGFYVHMSVDNGVSYNMIGTSINLQPYGTLQADYGTTYTVDEITGFEIDFEADGNLIESVTWPDVYSGNRNTAILGDEIISFKTITPVTETKYKIEDIIRGRFGTQKIEHLAGEDFWIISKNIDMFSDVEIAPGAGRKFKLVPYNIKKSGSIANAGSTYLYMGGRASKPYKTPNFNAEGASFNSLYATGNDITLEWSPTYKGKGAGVGTAGNAVITDEDFEGLYRIEVWVSSVMVRETVDIDALTWDYTNAMNVADNTTPADEIEFRLYNYIVDGGFTYECDMVNVTCYKG